jgi:hypothetical protein
MTDNGMTTGGCLCGAVRYRVRGPLRDLVACHCGQCRRQHGHFGVHTTLLPLAALDLPEEGSLAWYASSPAARRGFCRDCGSALFWQRTKDGAVAIVAGSLDRSEGLRLARHIFVAGKPDFDEINDGLPQSDGYPAPTGP